MTNIVIDTNILCKSFLDKDMMSASVIFDVYNNENIKVVFDYGETIMREYRREVGHEEFFQKWLRKLQDTNRIEFNDGRLDNKIKRDLINLGFHEETDQVFVATSLNADKIILTEDSDYGKGKLEKAIDHLDVLEYMRNILRMVILDSDEAYTYLKAI